ncbi:BppU family phage baseplate upper protein, partial [Enterococcus hirae]
DTRTPNISQFKYFGEGLKDSNNPNDYSWDVTPEYTEKSLNNTVSLTEPQSVEGLKNFEDGLQIAGKEVATVPEDTGWVNLTAINGHSWNKQGQIRRVGKLVMFRGSLKGSTLSTQDFCTIPEGFRPSNPTDNYEYQFLLPPQSSNTLDNGGMAYIRPNGVCGLPSFRGTVNLFLAPIQYYID